MKELHGYIRLDTHPRGYHSHSSPLFALTIAMALLALQHGILSNCQDASKPNSFGLLGASRIQGVSG